MADKDFQSASDVHGAARALKRFARDAIVARVFEGFRGESNLFHADLDRLKALARRVSPELSEYEAELKRATERVEALLGPDHKGLCIDLDDGINDVLEISKQTMFEIGIVLGARLADPTGKAADIISEGWIVATLAQPKHAGLPNKRQRDQKSASTRITEES